jgi:HSP20 family molecular chaperone IbpA
MQPDAGDRFGADKVSADLDIGVLTIRVPKSQGTKSRHVTIGS